MGKENNLMVEYLRDNHRFADLFNGGLFAGKCVVKADELDSTSENYTEFSVPPADKVAGASSPVNTVPRSRDVSKQLKCGAPVFENFSASCLTEMINLLWQSLLPSMKSTNT